MKRILTQHKEKEPFERIKKGQKKVEIRLHDKKRRKIKIGQIIKILERESNKYLLIKVIGLSRFPSFDILFSVLKNKVKPYEKKLLNKIYSKSDEKRFGVIAIHFKLINPKRYNYFNLTAVP